MKLSLSDKKAVVAEVAAIAAKSISVVAADYRGLTVEQMTSLRRNARKMGVRIQVVRNTLSRRAFIGTKFEAMQSMLVGPLVLAFANDAPGAAARVIRDFVKDNEKLIVKAISIGDGVLAASALDMVADLPTKDEALARMCYVMKAPVEQLVRTLAEPYAQLARTLAAIRDQKQAA